MSAGVLCLDTKRTLQSPSAHLVVGRARVSQHVVVLLPRDGMEGETQLDDSRLKGRSLVDRVTFDLTPSRHRHDLSYTLPLSSIKQNIDVRGR